MLGALGFLLGLVVRLWLATLRLTLETRPEAQALGGAPRVYAFFHGHQMALLRAPRDRKTFVLVSLSRDGALQAGVMRALGFAVRRGSSSRRGAAGLRGVVRALGTGLDAAFAVDGPKGPRETAKAGAARAAELGSAALVPVSAVASRSVTLRRAWDRFEVPVPFSRVVVVVGAPVNAVEARARPQVLAESIRAARLRAEAVAAAGGSWQTTSPI